MARTVDVSGLPAFVFQCVLASFLVLGGLVFTGAVVAGLLDTVGVDVTYSMNGPMLVAFLALWIGLTVLWVRHLRASDGDWWGPVPQRQYTGRFAGYGGLARHNWEKAIEQLPGHEEDDD